MRHSLDMTEEDNQLVHAIGEAVIEALQPFQEADDGKLPFNHVAQALGEVTAMLFGHGMRLQPLDEFHAYMEQWVFALCKEATLHREGTCEQPSRPM